MTTYLHNRYLRKDSQAYKQRWSEELNLDWTPIDKAEERQAVELVFLKPTTRITRCKENYNRAPVPEDATLSELRAFGRMKFKVRIISMAARYGIKLYVVAEADTAFVMGVLVYTGKYTYSVTRSESTKKTVQVVQQLCELLRGSHRTVYVDRFYSSVDLLKQLGDMHLYTTGTVLSNRIPRSMTIAKSSREFITLNHDDSVNHVLTNITTKGERKQAGLLTWKDRNIVYCITNDSPTAPMDECKRRGQGGTVTIKHPQVITKYNRHMGGVDLDDMRGLHCHSTIMG
ncbi:transposase IS4 [Nitzschia inconspicua]|uniref:Transposase IS4 n=1 Tax=Nitzschia inconspicua TaxID=303405 RepID=A0A9K3L1K8_9STRA|nr:transposase IS4 [Nitzschia inconspicua]